MKTHLIQAPPVAVVGHQLGRVGIGLDPQGDGLGRTDPVTELRQFPLGTGAIVASHPVL